MRCKGSSTADPHRLLLLRHSFSFRVSSAVESQRSGFQSTLHHILVLTGDDLCLGCLVFNFFDDLSEQEFRNSLEIGSLGQVLETDSEKTRQAVPSVKLLLHQLKSLYQSKPGCMPPAESAPMLTLGLDPFASLRCHFTGETSKFHRKGSYADVVTVSRCVTIFP